MPVAVVPHNTHPAFALLPEMVGGRLFFLRSQTTASCFESLHDCAGVALQVLFAQSAGFGLKDSAKQQRVVVFGNAFAFRVAQYFFGLEGDHLRDRKHIELIGDLAPTGRRQGR